MTPERINLYEDERGRVLIQADSEHAWLLESPVAGSRFDVDAPEWLAGRWSPGDDYMRRAWEPQRGSCRRTLIAVWTRQGLTLTTKLPGSTLADYADVAARVVAGG